MNSLAIEATNVSLAYLVSFPICFLYLLFNRDISSASFYTIYDSGIYWMIGQECIIKMNALDQGIRSGKASV